MEKYLNASLTNQLDDLITQQHVVKKVNHKGQAVILFTHESIPNLLVDCVEQYMKVEVEGARCNYFD